MHSIAKGAKGVHGQAHRSWRVWSVTGYNGLYLQSNRKGTGKKRQSINMQTIKKTFNVYTIDELDEKAQEHARSAWAEINDYYFLIDELSEQLHQLLKDRGIIDLNDTSKPGTKPTQVMYSLNYCQGDGAMFEGAFIYTHKGKQYLITVKHAGRYYHCNSKTIEVSTEDVEEVDECGEVEKAFNVEYVEICKELERAGYRSIEYEDSMEKFFEMCSANDYLFTVDGELYSAV